MFKLGFTKEELTINQLTESFLLKTGIFNGVSQKILKEITASLVPVELKSGQTLFQEDDSEDNLYFVLYGRLIAIQEDTNTNKRSVIEIKQNEVVGEVSLFINGPRRATVKSVRDSILLQMSHANFNYFTERYPTVMMQLAKACIKRLVSPSHSPKIQKNSLNITIIPAANYVDWQGFAMQLSQVLANTANTILITKANLGEILGINLSDLINKKIDEAYLLSRIYTLEEKYHYIIYVADNTLTSWTTKCLGQADRIVLVANTAAENRLNEVENWIFSAAPNQETIRKYFVLLHEEHHFFSGNTEAWLEQRKIDDHFHVNKNDNESIASFARIITGKGIGLVLCGGGANAILQLGVIKALQERKIHIDYIGGSSMGALLGGFYSIFPNYKDLMHVLLKLLKLFKNKRDFTLPIMSFISGKYLTQILKECCGSERVIENLWKKFFCVSTDITNNKIFVHNEGLLYQAIRASISVPGIFPPMVNKAGNDVLLVDGGIINNLPVDIMKAKINGGKVIAVNITSTHDHREYHFQEESFSLWRLFLKQLFSRKKNIDHIPTIAETIVASMLVASHANQQEMAKLADYCIHIPSPKGGLLDFNTFPGYIKQGYQAAMGQLDGIII